MKRQKKNIIRGSYKMVENRSGESVKINTTRKCVQRTVRRSRQTWKETFRA